MLLIMIIIEKDWGEIDQGQFVGNIWASVGKIHITKTNHYLTFIVFV